mmetsp:Transcript_17781/g.44110  ORF Transcript_17781/g.44110 Transcript_17781/m.44110 type:complete len:153 (-) Transcript_17781:255-713(-)
MFYGASVFDPLLIVLQMGAVQGFFYASLFITMGVIDLVFGFSLSPFQLLAWQAMTPASAFSWVTMASFVISAFIGGVSLYLVVERAKKCLDFTLTVHIFHFVACWVYGGFPLHWTWWVVTALDCVIMTLFGEYLCMKKELREIPIGGSMSMR